MKTYFDLVELLGTRGALRYLKDYHQSRINLEGTFDDAMYLLDSYAPIKYSATEYETSIMEHARLMNDSGSDLLKYTY